MKKIGIEKIYDCKKKVDIMNYLEKVKKIDKNKIKKIIIIGSLVVVIAIGVTMTFKYITGINIIDTISTLVVNEKIVEGADFTKEIIKEGATFSIK